MTVSQYRVAVVSAGIVWQGAFSNQTLQRTMAGPGCPNPPCLRNCLGRIHLSKPGDTLRMSRDISYKSVSGSCRVWKWRQILKVQKMEPLGWIWCWFERMMLLWEFRKTPEKGDLVLCFLLISSTPDTHRGVSEAVQNQISSGWLKLQPGQELALSERTRVSPATGVSGLDTAKRGPILP